MSDHFPFRFCAVDGGGSGCRAVLATEEGTLGPRGTAGPANVTTDRRQALTNVTAAITNALAQAGFGAEAISGLSAHVGLAGVLTPEDASSVAEQLPFADCAVTDDRAPLAAGALGTRDGLLLAVGTGSFGALQRGEETRYFGGWGLQLGDEGSGAWLGRELLSHCLRGLEGLASVSDLTQEVTSRFRRPSGIVAFAQIAQPADYAEFAPRIVAAASAGDPVGLDLMTRGAGSLRLICSAAKLSGADVLCLAGGLGPQYAPYLTGKVLARRAAPLGDALDGGLRLARTRFTEKTPKP